MQFACILQIQICFWFPLIIFRRQREFPRTPWAWPTVSSFTSYVRNAVPFSVRRTNRAEVQNGPAMVFRFFIRALCRRTPLRSFVSFGTASLRRNTSLGAVWLLVNNCTASNEPDLLNLCYPLGRKELTL